LATNSKDLRDGRGVVGGDLGVADHEVVFLKEMEN
jgi:hypothetical protein